MDATAPIPTTTALLPAFEPLKHWALEVGLWSECACLLNATLLQIFPPGIGNVLHFLARPSVRERLWIWATANDATVEILHRLSVALAAEPRAMLKRFPPFSGDMKVPRRFIEWSGRPLVTSHYLLGMLMVRDPVSSDPTAHATVDLLRTWILAHGFARAAHNNLQDEYVQAVADRVRLFCDDDERQPVFVAAISRLKITGRTFYSLSHVNDVLRREAERSISHQVSPGALAFLRAIRHLANNESKPFELHYPGNSFPLLHDAGQTRSKGQVTPTGLPEALKEDEDDNASLPLLSQDDELQVVEVTPDETPAVQHLSARTVRLLTEEELQFLPWSWNRILPDERQALTDWINQAINSEDHSCVGLPVCVALALQTGRSLRQVSEFVVSDIVSEDWRLTTDLAALHRRAPRPKGVQLADETIGGWTRPVVGHHRIRFCDSIRKALQQLKSAAPVLVVVEEFADLLPMRADQLNSLFGEALREVVPRLKAGMLQNDLAARVFEKSLDPVLARLLSASPQTGLSGALFYPYFADEVVKSAWTTSHWGEIEIEGPGNAAGSLLAVVDEAINREVLAAKERLLSMSARGEWWERHNAYAQWVVVYLLAATGARNVESPFESVADFDCTNQFVFVDDKAGSLEREGRCIPLPDLAISQFEHYLTHLGSLAKSLGDEIPELSLEFQRVLDSPQAAAIPLFFQLQVLAETITWAPITFDFGASSCLFQWPLPRNLFRHRLATRLRELAVDSEVIDGVLGHQEVGEATWGDHSPRVWRQDVAAVRPALEAALLATGFSAVEAPAIEPSGTRLDFVPPVQTQFGRRRRATERERSRANAIKDAREIIAEFRAAHDMQDWAALDDGRIEQLQRLLFLNEAGLRHPYGLLRLEVLQRLLDCARRRGERIRVLRRMDRRQPQPSPFTPWSPGAIERVTRLRQILQTATDAGLLIRPGKSLAAELAALSLCLNYRVGDKSLLERVLAGRGIRLISVTGKAYLQVGEAREVPDAFRPVFSIAIDSATARLLELACEQQHAHSAPTDMPDAIHALPDELTRWGVCAPRANWESVLTGCIRLVNAANAQELPGVIAAVRAGRITTYSLNWLDLVRWKTGRHVTLAESPDEPQGDVTETAGAARLSTGLRPPDRPTRYHASRELFRQIRRVLASPRSFNSRQAMGRRIEQYLTESSDRISSSVGLLAEWIVSELSRSRGDGSHQLVLRSVRRYLSALSPRFVEVGYDMDIHALDSDEITTFYSNLLTIRGGEPARDVVNRLRGFHAWARIHHGLEDPDWSCLRAGNAGPEASPGALFEADYQSAMRRLLAVDGEQRSQARRGALVLMLAYRFGLRGNKAFGLRRKDILLEIAPARLVIRPFGTDKLKTRESRRVIPLLWPLDAYEKSLLAEAAEHARAVFGETMEAPVICLETGALVDAEKNGIRRRINDLLKKVSGNPATTLHDARHAFANRLAICLFDMQQPGAEHLFGVAPDDLERRRIRQLLQGDTQVTRRCVWALRRYLGHTGTSPTTFTSYVHLLGEWADAFSFYPAEKPAPRAKLPPSVYVLDDLPAYIAPAQTPSTAPALPRLVDVLRWMRHLGQGHSARHSAQMAGLPEETALKAEKLLSLVDQRIRLSPLKRSRTSDSLVGKIDSVRLVSHMSSAAWRILLDYAVRLPAIQPNTAWQIEERTFIEMFGTNRQLLGYTSEHFAWQRAFLNAIDIHDDDVVCCHGKSINTETVEIAQRYGFVPVDASGVGVSMDAMWMNGVAGGSVRYRLALAIRESATRPVRNSVFWIAMAVAVRIMTF